MLVLGRELGGISLLVSTVVLGEGGWVSSYNGTGGEG